MTRDYPEFPFVCWLASDYKGEKDFNNTYLGINKSIAIKPTVKLTALFDSKVEIDMFFTWWKEETNNGVDTFLVQTALFGKNVTYGIQLSSALSHSSNDLEKISFTGTVMFDSSTIDNIPPEADDLDVSVQQDSSDNFITLSASDAEGDSLEYEVTSGVSKGTLTGTPPNLLYTPYPSSSENDSFTYVAKDVFNYSIEATVTITVGEYIVPTTQFRYDITGPIIVNGNFFYDLGDGVTRRGASGYIEPSLLPSNTIFVSRDTIATYYSASGYITEAAINEPRYIDDVLMFEKYSSNLTTYSWSPYASAVRVTKTETTVVVPTNATIDNICSYYPTEDGGTHYAEMGVAYQVMLGSPRLLNYSVFVKKADVLSQYCRLSFNLEDGGITTNIWVDFDIENKTIYNTDTSVDLIAYEIEDFGNVDGWIRISIGVSLDASPDATAGFIFSILSPTGDYEWTPSLEETVLGFTVWGGQLERDQADGLSSYIATDFAYETRAADLVNYRLSIWSDDHTIDKQTDVVSAISVINWGTRTDYTNLLKDHTILEHFTTTNAIGACKGTNFNGTFWGFDGEIPVLDMSNGVYFQDTFRDISAMWLPTLDFSNGKFFQRMLMGSSVTNVTELTTTLGVYFQDMFKDSDITCIEYLDTRNKNNTSGMFNNTTIANPDTAAQAVLLAGGTYTNPSVCKLKLDEIVEVTPSTCNISTLGSTCTSTGDYSISVTAGTGSGNYEYQWFTTDGTIVGSSTLSTVSISKTAGADTRFMLRCEVTDTLDSSVAYTPAAGFEHTVTTSYLTLTLPKSYSKINLKSFIDANNPTMETEILIINDKVNCTTETGDWNAEGWNVEFRNSGQLQAFVREDGELDTNTAIAFEATSPIQLINTGSIKACGGRGAKGGDGLDYTIINTQSQNNGSYWKVRIPEQALHLYVNGEIVHTRMNADIETFTGPIVYDGKTYTRGALGYSYPDDTIYFWNATWGTNIATIGGLGGVGGYGCGYGNSDVWTSDWRNADFGELSFPTGGYSGGTGGIGGWWGEAGQDGYDGVNNPDSGATGSPAGKGIVGKSYFKTGSIIGSVNGVVE